MRNQEVNNRFALNPVDINIPRSKFNRSSSIKFSANVGEIIPFYWDEVLPGDTFQIKTSKLVRLQTLVAPIMDNLYLDVYYFYIPARLTWTHWKQFNGENTASKWIPSATYSIPQITSPQGGWQIGTIADYLGIPTGVSNLSVSALPFRSYAIVMNEWFRDENNLDYLDIPLGDATVQGVNTGTFVTDVAKGGKPYIAAKFHDYFTSALPSPQKGNDVGVSLGSDLPIYTYATPHDFTSVPKDISGNAYALHFSKVADGTSAEGNNVVLNSGSAGSTWQSWTYTPEALGGIYPDNLYAPLSDVTAITINNLRLAFATQRMYEKDARGGSRYVEMIKTHFGVTSPDARQQRPEYLGGDRIPININQVVQTSGEVGNTPQGNVAGYSVTSGVNGDFIKSFTEHGFVMGFCVVRYDHTYQQGLERAWTRKNREDFYLPVFAHLGEQPIYVREIYAQGNQDDDKVFGYQEAWAEYRYKPSRVAGEMRSQATNSLDVWHLADDYNSVPVLQSSWIQEDKSNLDRALQVTSAVSNQYWADFFISCETTRPMPLYSIPGLIDHF